MPEKTLELPERTMEYAGGVMIAFYARDAQMAFILPYKE